MRRLIVLSAALFLLPVGCAAAPIATSPPTEPPMPTATPLPAPDASPTTSGAVRYVALGDSYTIGTSVSVPERFPNQLVERLRGTLELELVANLGVNGYTSRDLIEQELPRLDELDPELVTLLIGVNDVVQRVPEQQYRANVVAILGHLLGRLPAQGIVVVSTPDYTRTPRGADFGAPERQRAAIARFNEIMREEAEQRGIAFVDIRTIADRTGSNPALVAPDLLHPSGEQYSRWVDFIAPVVGGPDEPFAVAFGDVITREEAF